MDWNGGEENEREIRFIVPKCISAGLEPYTERGAGLELDFGWLGITSGV